MAKKKNKKYAGKGAVEAARVDALRTALATGELVGGSDAEVSALAERLASDEAVEALVRLHAVAAGKAQTKAVNRALYRLKQKGLSVPVLRERPRAVDLTVGRVGVLDLPTLVHEPFTNAGRMFFMPYENDRRLMVIQAQFEEPVGLEQLRGSDMGRARFRAMVKSLTTNAVVEGHPVAVQAAEPLRQRKLWEIGRCVREGRLGGEVDRALVSELRWPEEPPPHPIDALDLQGVEAMSIPELDAHPRLLAAFLNQKLWDRIEFELDAAAASPLVLSEVTEAERARDIQRRALAEWLEGWNLESLAELFRDAAYFHAQSGNRAAAKTLRDAIAGEAASQKERARDFLEQVLLQIFAGQPAPSSEPPTEAGSGILTR